MSDTSPTTTFADLDLNPKLLEALAKEGYTTPTPIQAQAIPFLLRGRDLLGLAQTGTGKTAAFLLPILHRLAANRQPAPPRGAHVLILAPTRELASQIDQSIASYGQNLGMSHTVVFGGVSQVHQVAAMRRGVDFLIATPGRLLDLVSQGHIDLGNTGVLVLDEADQMLDMGFVKPIRQAVAMMPTDRQTLPVLRHHADRHRSPRRQPAARPGAGRSHAAGNDSRAHRPDGDVHRSREQAEADRTSGEAAEGQPAPSSSP